MIRRLWKSIGYWLAVWRLASGRSHGFLVIPYPGERIRVGGHDPQHPGDEIETRSWMLWASQLIDYRPPAPAPLRRIK